jgi:peptide-methionine (S)-S-oxide reductase
MTTYVLAGGCFWCLDAVYRQIKGVSTVVSGYTGGTTINPGYYDVATGATGHAEAVKITFDESVIPESVILDMFFLAHDPTTLNRQGADIGTQYRSAMYYIDDTQKALFEAAVKRAQPIWNDPIVTEISPLDTFYGAEDEHQDYFNKNPEAGYCSVVIAPKVAKVRAHYAEWLVN